MLKPRAISTALAAVAIAVTIHNKHAQAFQPSRSVVLSQSVSRDAPFATSASSFRTSAANVNNSNQRRKASIGMAAGRCEASEQPSHERSIFELTSKRTRRALRKIRRSFTVLVASFAFFLSSTRTLQYPPPAHAASTATASTLSSAKKLNPFRTRSADEMIDAYVRDRLFADDKFDPVESAYREAFADAGGQVIAKDGGAGAAKSSAAGAYPALLAETAGAALGREGSLSSVLSASTASAARGKNDGVTAVLIRASDFLQSKLRVSASVSNYILTGGGLVAVCVLPGTLGVLYQGIQRMQIDKSEMKMFGKISDMDATIKKGDDDDDDDDDEGE